MITILIALLGHPEYAVRETAEAFLHAAPRVDLHPHLRHCADPEAAQRLRRAYLSAVGRDVDALLSPAVPFWPDCDAIWDRPDDRPLYTSNPHQGAPAWLAFRAYTRGRVFDWVYSTGDTLWPRIWLAKGYAHEASYAVDILRSLEPYPEFRFRGLTPRK